MQLFWPGHCLKCHKFLSLHSLSRPFHTRERGWYDPIRHGIRLCAEFVLSKSQASSFTSQMEVYVAGVNETMFLARFLCRSVTSPQEEPGQRVSRNVCHWTPCAPACAPRKAVTSPEKVVQSVRYWFASFSQTRDNSYIYVCNGHSLCQGPHRRKWSWTLSFQRRPH